MRSPATVRKCPEEASVNLPVSRLRVCTLPEDGVTSATSMLLGGGCLTVGTGEAAAGSRGCTHALVDALGCVKMEVASMMPAGGALTGGGRR